MSPLLWLSHLKRQFRNGQNRKIRLRGKRNQQHRSAAAVQASPQMAETLEDRTLLTAFIVMNTDDSGAGSLRDAIEQANANAGADTITFDASLAGQSIVLSTELQITDDLTVTGLGSDLLTLDGNGDSQIFQVDDGVFNNAITVEISGLTLTNGSGDRGGAIFNQETLSIIDSILSGNTASLNGGAISNYYGDLSIQNSKLVGNMTGTPEADGYGAGIYQLQGTLTIDNSELTGNQALGLGGGVYILQSDQFLVSHSQFSSNSAHSGGAIYNNNNPLTVEQTLFTENHATGLLGGAIYTNKDSVQISQSQFIENDSVARGGGLFADSGTLTVSTSLFSGNSAETLGGGIQINRANVSVSETTFVGNEAATGGALAVQGRGSLMVSGSTFTENIAVAGGAISNNDAINITIKNSTISYNQATLGGSAFDTFVNSDVSIINSTIVGNEVASIAGAAIFRADGAGSFLLQNSIVAGNTRSQFAGNYTGSNNILQQSLEGLIDPVLSDNGGPTETHALLPGSAALDAGSNSAALTAGLTQDQRGSVFKRIYGDTVDIGAYEFQSLELEVDTTDDIDDGDISPGHLSLREAVRLANTYATADTIMFAPALAGQTIVLTSELLISDDVTIIGLGADQLTLDGGGNSRIFNINNSLAETEIIVELSGLTLRNGFADDGGAILNYENLTVKDSTVSGNHASAVYSHAGGGIYSAAGKLTVTGSKFTDNSAYSGGGIATFSTMLTVTNTTFFSNAAQDGGGIYFESPYQNDSYIASVVNSRFEENNITGNGAGIRFEHGQASVLNSVFTGNISDRVGGGIANYWTTLLVEDSTFHQNYARVYGGGISNGGIFSTEGGGDFTLFRSTLSENSTVHNGGGIYTNYGLTRILNSTLSGNSTLYTGGGIYLGTPNQIDPFSAPNVEGPAEMEIFSSTITGNSANSKSGIYTKSQIEITNSIVAGNTVNNSGSQNYGPITAYNCIIQDSIAGLLDPVLRDNGGPTKTHALIAGSAAINAGDSTQVIQAGIEFDQRGTGFDRIVGTAVDIGAYEVDIFHAQIDLRIVDEPTATAANGEAEDLPANLLWIDEWGSYWLEIWISTPSTTDRGILSAALQLSYDTSITTPTSIEYGQAFSINQTGDINDQTGTVENLSAESSLTDVGDDQYVLFARIRFESTEQDGIDLDLEGQNLNPQRPDFEIDQSEIRFSEGSSSNEVYGTEPYTQIWANIYDLNDDDAVNFRDLILFTSVYNSIPSESSSVYAWFADLDRNDRVNFQDLISFASNYGKSKSKQSTLNFPQHYPFLWNQFLIVDSQGTRQDTAPAPTQSAAETVLDSVVEQITPQLSPAQQQTLSEIDIKVVDLAGDTLGRAAAGTIYIDVNAAGYGWFIDAAPAEHSEFSPASGLTLIALPDSEAAGLIDLRTVILHELSHLLGFDHSEDGLMQETLAPGVRYLADWESDTDEFFGSLADNTELSPF